MNQLIFETSKFISNKPIKRKYKIKHQSIPPRYHKNPDGTDAEFDSKEQAEQALKSMRTTFYDPIIEPQDQAW